jgi:DNA-binding MarR family transcriptional regulator
MKPRTAAVKVQNTRNTDALVAALIDLVNLLNSPRRDDVLLREAGVDLDRALFPLLVRIGMRGTLSVAELADQVGRDHTTISRQLTRLESLGLIARDGEAPDRRVRPARLTQLGEGIVRAIGLARRRLLGKVLGDWTEADRAALAAMLRRFADALAGVAREPD